MTSHLYELVDARLKGKLEATLIIGRVEGKSYRQIADELGVSKSTIHSWCHSLEVVL
jgi:DNA-directed RNA polymerase specialized sigma24 family protein